jgi:preprotein translocase subunit SecB
MADEFNGIDPNAGFGEQLANGADTAPALGLISQYVKDLSFENPNAPAIFQTQAQPAIDVQFNIGTSQVADDVHEVVLKIEARAESEGTVAFIVDLSFAGLFGIRNVPDEHLRPFLLGEAPHRPARGGGFPQLLLDPIDFSTLYLQQAEQDGINISGQTGHA